MYTYPGTPHHNGFARKTFSVGIYTITARPECRVHRKGLSFNYLMEIKYLVRNCRVVYGHGVRNVSWHNLDIDTIVVVGHRVKYIYIATGIQEMINLGGRVRLCWGNDRRGWIKFGYPRAHLVCKLNDSELYNIGIGFAVSYGFIHFCHFVKWFTMFFFQNRIYRRITKKKNVNSRIFASKI